MGCNDPQNEQGGKKLLLKDRQEDEVRLRALELGFGRVEEKLISINSTLTRIDQLLRIEERQ